MADRASFLAPAADKPWYVDFSTPPSRSKRFGYRVWFGLILLMESAIGRKQVAKLASFAPELAAEFRTYTFVQMSLHVLFDLLALALLNALHPRVGVRVPRSPPHDARAAPAPAPAPVLRVRPEIPILARHTLKLALRVATIALRVSCFEGYSMKQCLLMTIMPTAFAHGFVKHSFAACAAMGCVNYAFVRVVAAFTPAAYSFTSDGMRGDLFADVAPDELAAQLRDVVAPVVFASSFICQFLFSGSEWFSTRLKALSDPADASGGSLRAAADAVDASMRDEDAFPGLRAASADPERRGTFWRPSAYAIDPLAFEVLPTEALPDSPEARARFKPLGHPARRRSRRLSSTPGASAFETRVRRRRCVAAGCADRVDASSVVRDGLELCAFHHTATTAFQRRAYPVVAAVRDADPTTTAFDSAAASDRLAEYRRLSNARKAPGRSFVASVWYKTHSDPSTAAAALGATVADVVADAPGGGASVLALAVMSVRPGCSLVTVDASGDFDASDSSSESGSGSGNTGRTSGRSGRSRARRWEDDVDALASALASRGAVRRLRGTLVFRAADPVTGASRTTRAEFRGERGERGEGGGDFAPEPEFVEEAFADAAAADAFFSEYVDGSDERYSLIARAALVRECVRARDPGSAMKTLLGGADERRRTMSLPLPPPGHAYSLRCGGSYVPLLARRPSTAEIKDGLWGYASVVVSRTDAEGLGFLELVEVPALRGGGGTRTRTRTRPPPAAPPGAPRRSLRFSRFPCFSPRTRICTRSSTARRASWTPSLCSTSARRSRRGRRTRTPTRGPLATPRRSTRRARAPARGGPSRSAAPWTRRSRRTRTSPGVSRVTGTANTRGSRGASPLRSGLTRRFAATGCPRARTRRRSPAARRRRGPPPPPPSTRSGNLCAAASTDSRRSSRRRRTFCGGARSRPARGSPRSSARRAPPGRARRCASRWRRRFAARASPPSATL